MMDIVLAKAVANAKAIESLVSGGSAPAQAPAAEAAPVAKAEEEKKEDKKEEEAGVEGLGALFG